MTSRRPSQPYRADIDGLRALAIVPVCLFHAGVPAFAGGFVGVDVFFVISGYLMASTIGGRLAAGEFSLLLFYERRARRILPALFVMLACSALAAACLVPPKLFRDFGATLTASLLFASNLGLWWKSANYFDAPNGWNPLLHTWSLAVEEQFYLLFPLFLGLVWRSTWRVRLLTTGLVAAASYALGIWATAHAPTAAFYLLPARAWELLGGALLALWKLRARRVLPRSARVASVASGLGLALVLGSLLGFDQEMPFPGLLAGIPCLGAGLLLYFGNAASSWASRGLALPPLSFVGRISYSLYLWHWPLLVFVQKYGLLPGTGQRPRLAALVGSFVVAWLSWRWVEQPVRSSDGAWTSKRVWGAAGGALIVLGLAGALAVTSNGWPRRFPGLTQVSLERQTVVESAEPDAAKFDDGRCFVARASAWKGEDCFLTHAAADNALLWGDSFAARYAYGFSRAAARSSLNVLEYTSPQCPPIIGYTAASRPECAAFNQGVPALVSRYRITTVILVANWSAYLRRRKLDVADIRATVGALRQLGVRVVLVGQSPVFAFAYPDEYFWATFGTEQGERGYDAPVDLDPGLNQRIFAAASPDVCFDPLALWCRGLACRFKQGSRYLYVDGGHYSHYGSQIAVDALLEAMAPAR